MGLRGRFNQFLVFCLHPLAARPLWFVFAHFQERCGPRPKGYLLRCKPFVPSFAPPLLRRVFGAVALLALVCSSGNEPCRPAYAADDPLQSPIEPKDYRSRHVIVHTDLPEADAQQLMTRLEATLTAISEYWQRPLRGTIECYVIQDIDHWSDANTLPANVRMMIRNIGGATVLRRQSSGNQSVYQATVYAVTRQGVAEHEIVHAYCIQTFAAMGPDWYKEGMAQMTHHRREGERGLACAPEVLARLRQRPRRTVTQIVNAGNFTSPIGDSLNEALARGEKVTIQEQEHDEVWLKQDTDTVQKAFQHYYLSWALCHLLHHNPNYSARFRMLGRAYLTQQDVTFAQVFGPMADEIGFEYEFFLDHVDQGYRADLCAWDWEKKFRPLTGDEEIVSRVLAARGYQPSGITVSAGHEYLYRAEGTWTFASGATATNVGGDPQGRSGLEAVVMKDFVLSEPIVLSAEGILKPSTDGKLYLRCRDDWNQLDDNQGTILVRFRLPS